MIAVGMPYLFYDMGKVLIVEASHIDGPLMGGCPCSLGAHGG